MGFATRNCYEQKGMGEDRQFFTNSFPGGEACCSPTSVLQEEEEVSLGLQPTVWEVKDEQEEFPCLRAVFPSPGLWARDSSLLYFISHGCLFFQALRKSAVACSRYMVSICSFGSPEISGHPLKICGLQKSCPSLCRRRHEAVTLET